MIYNLGSINLDLVYQMTVLPKAGETLAATGFDRFLGGKGVNQSVAARAAGAAVYHIGAVGADGDWVLSEMERFNIATAGVARVEAATGHAIVAVDQDAENQIIIFSGANRAIPLDWVETQLSDLAANDYVLCQNETNLTAQIAARAQAAGAKLVLSAAPFDADHVAQLRPYVHLLAVNEGEAAALAQAFGTEPGKMGFPMLVVTKGAGGTDVFYRGEVYSHPAFEVDPVDTTGAGDTFIGSFVARLSVGDSLETALRYASAAAALQVTQPGAASAIPQHHTVLKFLEDRS